MKKRSKAAYAATAGVALAAAALGAVGATVGTAGASNGKASTSKAHTTRAPKAASGGVIKFAESPSAPPNYIFPVTTSTYQSLFNIDQFINLMYPAIYAPEPNQPVNDYAQSMADAPTHNAADTVFTVKLKHFMWSDGTPVTARDYVFYINMAKAEGSSYGDYAGPTQFPYNLKSYKAVNDDTLQLTLKSPENPNYFTYNGIGYMTALPQQAWDKESANGKVGNYDMTAAGAKKVLAFLQGQASKTSTYATNPLWQVVDGAWTLKSFGGASSPDVFVPNPSYSGPKPKVSEFEEIPFTTSSAEFTSLKSGTSTLSYGGVPQEDIPAISSVKSAGFNVTATPTWGFDNIEINFANPTVGPILKQLYIRQALEEVTDQQGMIKHYMYGYGIPTYGPVPVRPTNNVYVTKVEEKDQYPFSVAHAVKLLKDNGWTVSPGGVDTCTKPGTKKGDCGAGIASGAQLSFNLLYSSGLTVLQEEVDLFVSDASQAGIKINATSQPFNTVLTETTQCNPKQGKTSTGCKWELNEFGGFGDSTLPSGNGLYNTGGAFNYGEYSNKQMDTAINNTPTAKTLQPLYQYEDIAATQLPNLWEPVPDNMFATAKNLAGEGLTSEFAGGFSYIEPQYWYFTK